jgi:phenylpropionate dioxygenase-like ring-hydroxylating dioxygenase large terminal subunit
VTAAQTPTTAGRTAAPPADHFPAHAAGWYLFAHEREFARGPVARDMLGRRLVGFRGAGGAFHVMDARCSHLGADLGRGSVHGDCLRCPFHHWEYGPDGRCRHIPAQAEIPRHARQRTYPAARMGPLVFVFNGHAPLYPLPFYAGCDPADFTPAEPFTYTLDCPWYLVGANGFDSQHFAAAHDRKMEAPPEIGTPAGFARSAAIRSRVVGTTWQDRATRLLSGDVVTMTATDWSGALIFVTARFRRSTSFGMVNVRALGPRTTFVQVVVWVRTSRGRLARRVVDPLHLAARRYFIRKFLESDGHNLQGCDYRPQALVAADATLIDYFQWLSHTSNGIPVTSPH